MKIRTLALALMLGTALTACQKSQDTSAQEAAAAVQAEQVTAAQQAAESAQKEAEAAKQEAAAAQKRAAAAERRARESSSQSQQAVKQAKANAAICNDCGTVVSIQAVKQKPDGSGAGAVLGAAAGGVAGHQVGGGRGKDVATVLGALAGAYAGNQAEKAIRAETVYEVGVRMDDGASRTVTVKDASGLSVGSKVRVDGSNLALR